MEVANFHQNDQQEWDLTVRLEGEIDNRGLDLSTLES